jgi:uncharacterized protein YyaL (SSP411 family)
MRKNKLFFYLCLLAFVLFGAISAQAKVLDASMKGVQNPALRIDVTQNQPHTIVLARNYLSSTIQNQTKTGAENNKISHRELEESLVLAGEYLKKAVKENGSFVYEYHPPSDEESPEYNMLRHAGTIYDMADLYRLTKDKILLEKTQKAISFLLKNLKNTQVNGQNVLVALDNDNIKLGGNALAILALTEYMEVTDTREYLETAQKLAR